MVTVFVVTNVQYIHAQIQVLVVSDVAFSYNGIGSYTTGE